VAHQAEPVQAAHHAQPVTVVVDNKVKVLYIKYNTHPLPQPQPHQPQDVSFVSVAFHQAHHAQPVDKIVPEKFIIYALIHIKPQFQPAQPHQPQ
jgi:hypothetical protein